jgi:PAS domain S-box-containing protein
VTADLQSAPLRATALGKGSRTHLAVALLVAATALGVWLSFWWVANERERDLRVWQDRLGIIADSRAVAVAAWLRERSATVSALADDEVVRLYAAELRAAVLSGTDGGDAVAQREYLEHLLVVTADRTGFAYPPDAPSAAAPRVAANVPRRGVAGIAILDADLRVVAATPGLPPFDSRLRGFVASRVGAPDAAHSGPFPGVAGGRSWMAFAAPLRDIGDDRVAGIVVGVRPVGDDLFALLRQPGATEVSAEAMLLAARDAAVAYLSPLADGTPPLGRTLALDTPDLAAAWALRHPGGFSIARDYRDVPVVIASRTVAGSDWVLAYKVGRDEALGWSDARLSRMLFSLLLLVAAVSGGLAAVWRHGASRRASAAAARFRELATRFEQQSNFIRRLTDSQPHGIFVAAPDGRLAFANRRVAETTGAPSAESLAGKPLAAVFGPDQARRHVRAIRDAQEEDRPVITIERVPGIREGASRVLRTEYVPLVETAFAPAGVLAVEQDITDAIVLRERNERLLQQLVDTLLGVVDQRDPYAARQSAQVVAVAEAIAREMALEPVLVDTASKAASLMNLGKILVPRDLLVKADRLTDGEVAQVREALGAGVGLIAHVEFDGPVVETLRQMRAHVDGSGAPPGLAGAGILVTARIVSVANTFVAMISPRAHRAGLDFNTALDQLFVECGKTYDRAVVVALANVVDNRGGRVAWADFAMRPVADEPNGR